MSVSALTYINAQSAGSCNIKDSVGYFIYNKYKERGNAVGFIKEDIPLINKVKPLCVCFNITSPYYDQWVQIPFLTSCNSSAAAPVKVLWIGYCSSVGLHYALISGGVNHYLRKPDKSIEANIEVQMVELECSQGRNYSFKVPHFLFNNASKKYIDDLSDIDKVGTYVATYLEKPVIKPLKTLPEFMSEEPLYDDAQYVCSIDYLNYLYKFIYMVHSFPEDCFPPKPDDCKYNLVSHGFNYTSSGLIEALEKIWGKDLMFVDYIEYENFLKNSYGNEDAIEFSEESSGINWTSYEDFVENVWENHSEYFVDEDEVDAFYDSADFEI